MAAMTLKYELTCSICLDIYTCPVMLNCGHNFCKDCIQRLIEQQPEHGNESCPGCRTTFSPEDLHRVNFNLGNIAEYYKSFQDCHGTKEVPCTYCIQFPGTAVRTCLQCEASFCKKHLDGHKKSKEHVLVEPTTSLQHRKCSVHNEVFKYFCKTDKACICASCCLVGEHQDHLLETLEKASLSKKEQFKKVLKNIELERQVLKRRADVLHSILDQKKEKVAIGKKDLETIFSKFRERVVDANFNVMNEIGRQLGQVSKQIYGEISSVENSAGTLSQALVHVQVACSNADPLFALQDKVCSAIYNKSFAAQPSGGHGPASPARDIDMLLISLFSQKSLEAVSDHLPFFLAKKLVCFKWNVNILLNKATASNCLILSADLKTVRYCKKNICRDPSPDKFKTSQVLSIESFSTGKYFWEVKTSKTGIKAIGVAYPTIERNGLKAYLGYNEKSWCLIWGPGHIEVCHNSDCKQIVSNDSPMYGVGVYVDYEAGLLSFYRLCARVKHLHTITAKFTEPLHAAFYVVDSWIKINPQKRGI
ncbi:E3 ubiquitin/ISG15 ligase TRIM25-like [Rhinoderma darwinii]|uniref:E3 ubiquitin/ISG15 ligase TRIM25-like n=1 Tax=Rhinoderma darwinii TaxID=43563 RepID=UPI003F675819